MDSLTSLFSSDGVSRLRDYFSSAVLRNAGTMEEFGNRGQYLPTVRDVLLVKDILGKPKPQLPLEIIDTIIDFAEYWPHVKMEMERPIFVRRETSEDMELLRTPPLCYDMDHMSDSSATSPPLLPSRTLHPCRKIVFTILSEDQGWSNSSTFHGTFKGSFTWFDAVCESWTPHGNPSPERKHPFLPGAKTLQCNRLVTKEPSRYNITWSYLDTMDTNVDLTEPLDPVSGRGKETMNGDFVRNMKPGDYLVLWARSRFPGWENKVHEAEVKVFWAV